MIKFLLVFFLLTIHVLARQESYPAQECPAFNNMKHSKNTDAVHLDTKQKYTILDRHKGQVLVLVRGENPAQRWVDGKCFSKSKALNIENKNDNLFANIDNKRYDNISKQNILVLSWHNAFCETHRYKKECKRSIVSLFYSKKSDSQFALHGLWPQPRSSQYCNVDKRLVGADKNRQWRHLPCLALDEDVENQLEIIMPGYASDLHKHEWIKHGSCYGTDANRYYSDAINLTGQVNASGLGTFFSENIDKKVTLKQIRNIADREFGRGAGDRIELKCKSGLITELWLHLGSRSDDLSVLLQRGKKTRSRCHQGVIDRAGF